MASTFTARLNLEKIATGEQNNSWGTTERANQDLLDAWIAGYVEVDCAGSSDVTLTSGQYANRTIKLTGTLTGNISVIFPAKEGAWDIWNATGGAFTVTLKVSGQTGVAITQDTAGTFHNDASDMAAPGPVAVGLGGTGGTSVATALAALKAPFSAVTTQTGATLNTAAADRGKLIECDCTSNAITVNLLAVGTAGAGFMLGVVKTDSGSNAVTIDGSSSQTINGATTITLARQYEFAILISDGTEWWAFTGRSQNRADLDAAQTFTAIQRWSKGSDIASASPLVLGTDGNYFDVTGTTGFAAITVAAGALFMLQFDGILTLTHHATNLNLPTGANITTAAGDRMLAFSTGANTVHVIAYTRADGTSLVAQQKGVAQFVMTSDSALDTTATPITLDDSVPPSSEGKEVMTRTITPTNASSALVIDVTVFLSVAGAGANGGMIVALFKDSGVSAVAAAVVQEGDTSAVRHSVHFRYTATAGGTSEQTWRVRIGPSAAVTLTMNGSSGAREMGGVMASSISIMEILP